ncbi:MAG: Trans-aconitate 2-methyltransferase [Candidatus Methanophagaceae archaeon]|nr:MAG: Trans-aconitate 2-methyltransferase [Methanophagales archaeon]
MSYVFTGKGIAAERLEKVNKLFFPATKNSLQTQALEKVSLLVDLGCGPGYTTRALSSIINANEYLGLDNSKYFIEQARALSKDFAQIAYKLHDVTKTPFPAEKADIIYSRFLLTHMHTPKRTILDWGTQLSDVGMLIIEETEDIKTDVPVFKEYIRIADALLRSNGNILFIGKILDEWGYNGKLEKKYCGVAEVPTSTKQAAEIFLLNIPSWKDNEFIKEKYYGDIRRLESGLRGMREANDDKETIEWKIRQMVLRN